MKNKYFFLGVLLLCNLCNSGFSQRIFLNEFMASNSLTYTDAVGDYEDWVEIYNDENYEVNISGYYLTDNLSLLTKHKLVPSGSEMVIPAKGFLILWASSNTGKGTLHLGFGLSAGGESLALVAPDGTTVLDQFVFGAQKPDVSMGRSKDGEGSWVYYGIPTPRLSNNTSQGYNGFLNAPVFSKTGGFYTEAIQLGLTTTQPDATIIFTLDGSDPDPANLDGKVYQYKNSYPGKVGDAFGAMLTDTLRSFLYNKEISIMDRSKNPPSIANKNSRWTSVAHVPPSDFFKGTTVRAKVIKDGHLPSEVITHSYFVTPLGWERYSLPVASLTIPANQLYGYEEGIYNAGGQFDRWRQANPLRSTSFSTPANFRESGDTSERLGNFEYFESNSQNINQRVGVRLHGRSSRANLIKTFRLYARSELGESYFDYPFFKDYPYNSFKRLLLRPDDFNRTVIRDITVQNIGRGLNFDIQQGQPSVLFVNGEFWGLHMVRERFDRHYFERKYGIKEGDLDLLERSNGVPEEGDKIEYTALMKYIFSNDLKNPAHYNYVQSKMDIKNYTDYLINGIFIANKDWPENNIRFYRKKSPSPAGTVGPQDGRWRWVLYDTDLSFMTSLLNENDLERVVAHKYIFLKQLFAVPSYRDNFISRYADLLNSAYRTQVMVKKIDSMAALVKPYIQEHNQRLSNSNSWEGSVSDMKTFAALRPNIVRQHIKTYFNLAATYRLMVNVLQPEMGFVTVNTLDLKEGTPGVDNNPYPWQGIYFEGVPVTLIAKAKPGYRFVKWQGDVSQTKDTLILNLSGPMIVEAVFEVAEVINVVKLIHYWHFNNLPSGTLQSVAADSTILGGATITYPGIGTGYLDRVTGEGSAINAQYGQEAGTALRVRNPSNTRELILLTPSTNYKDIEIKWASVRTSSGAQEQKVYYSTDQGNYNWSELSGIVSINESFQLFNYSLKVIPEANNNPWLAIKVVFSGSNASGSSGNNRFDNISVMGILDNGGCENLIVWYKDIDNDGFSDGISQTGCNRKAGYKLPTELISITGDCNDEDAGFNPGAGDICSNGLDENCNGLIDEGCPITWYRDADGDSYGNGSLTKQAISKPSGFVARAGDCKDTDATIFPGASELCDGKDNDCDGIKDEGAPGTIIWYRDADGDTYGNADITKLACIQPSGFVTRAGDCKDIDAAVNPGTPEICGDGKDNNCNGLFNEGCTLPAITGVMPSKNTSVAIEIEEGPLLDISLWPNPAKDVFMVVLNKFEPNQKLELSLIQADGKVLQVQSLLPSTKGQQINMDVRRIPAGYYLLQARQRGLVLSKRVVIIK